MTRELDLAAPGSILRRSGVARLLDALEAPGEETRVVGGAVRNALLGREVKEVDLATTLRPDRVAELARAARMKAVPTGIEHGTVTVVVRGAPFEVTTLREDVETDGRHAVVRFGRDFAQDAIRRDFTINALSVGRDGALHDRVGGLADLRAGRVRFIGEARDRIREDFLRILRFFRFSAEYGEGPLDAAGLDSSIRERNGLDILSRERVRAELLRLLGARRAVEVVAILQESGLLLRLVGAVAELGRFARARGGPSDPVLGLAALCVATREDAERLADRLRLSRSEAAALHGYAEVTARLRSRAVVDRSEIRRLVAIFGSAPVLDAVTVTRGEPRPAVTEDGGAQLDGFAGGEPAPVLPLRGSDLIRRGLKPGPDVGRALARARAAWMDAGCPAEWQPDFAVPP